MLQELRDKSQGWIAKVIIGVIILIFALTGFEFIFGAMSNDQNIATVNGKGISVSYYNEVLDRTKNLQRQQLGANYDESTQALEKLKKNVLDDLIDYSLLTQTAENLGFNYSFKDSILREIYSSPEFLDDNGRFSPELWMQRVRALGYSSEQQLIQELLNKALISQVQVGIGGTSITTQSDIDYVAQLIKQTRSYSYKIIDAKSISDITDKEITDWYEANKDKLETKEQVIIEYVVLKQDNFLSKAHVSEDEIKNLYAKKATIASTLENRKRISHILIPITTTESEASAKAEIDEIASKLAKNEDFAQLAKQYSKDPATANDGGDLGFINEEDSIDPAFITGLKDLAKIGDTTMVKSRFGWHLLKLTDLTKPKIPALDAAMRNQLIDEIKLAKAGELYLIEQRKLDAEAYESFDDLARVAKDFGLTLEVSEPFSKETGQSFITANDKVIRAVFAEQALQNKENSSVIEITPTTSVVVRVKEHLLPKPMTLDQAKPEIIKQLQEDKAKVQADKLVATLKADKIVPSGDGWIEMDAVASPLQTVIDEKQETFTPAGYEVLRAAFAAPKPTSHPTITSLLLANGDYAVICLTKVTEFTGKLTAKERETIVDVLTSGLVSGEWAEFRNYIKDNADIKSYLEDQSDN